MRVVVTALYLLMCLASCEMEKVVYPKQSLRVAGEVVLNELSCNMVGVNWQIPLSIGSEPAILQVEVSRDKKTWTTLRSNYWHREGAFVYIYRDDSIYNYYVRVLAVI